MPWAEGRRQTAEPPRCPYLHLFLRSGLIAFQQFSWILGDQGPKARATAAAGKLPWCWFGMAGRPYAASPGVCAVSAAVPLSGAHCICSDPTQTASPLGPPAPAAVTGPGMSFYPLLLLLYMSANLWSDAGHGGALWPRGDLPAVTPWLCPVGPLIYSHPCPQPDPGRPWEGFQSAFSTHSSLTPCKFCLPTSALGLLSSGRQLCLA